MTLDRYGETVEPDEHPPCPNNGLSEDADGNPTFCPLCRPHLAPSRRQQRVWGYDRPPRPKESE